jgi:hypothetical protein
VCIIEIEIVAQEDNGAGTDSTSGTAKPMIKHGVVKFIVQDKAVLDTKA